MNHRQHQSLIAAKRMQTEPFDDDLMVLIDKATKEQRELSTPHQMQQAMQETLKRMNEGHAL